jgi:hypothetical protein
LAYLASKSAIALTWEQACELRRLRDIADEENFHIQNAIEQMPDAGGER